MRPADLRTASLLLGALLISGAALWLLLASGPPAQGRSDLAPVRGAPAIATWEMDPVRLARVARESSPPAPPPALVPSQLLDWSGTRFRLAGRLRDAEGFPVGEASVYLAPVGLPLQRVGKVDHNGAFEVRWRGAGERMQVVLQLAASGGRGTRPLLLSVRAGVRSEVRLQVRTLSDPWDTVCVDAEQYELYARHDVLDLNASARDDAWAGEEVESIRHAALARAPRALLGESGSVAFVDRGDRLACAPSGLRAHGVFALLDHMRGHGVALEYTQELVDEPVPAPGSASVRGVVLDAEGQPVPGARVALWSTQTPARTRRSGREGEFVFEGVRPGRYRLRAVCAGRGASSTVLEWERGAPAPWTARLERGLVLSGRLLRGQDEPLAQAELLVESREEDRLWTAVVHTDREGEFSLEGCPSGPLNVHVRSEVWGPVLFQAYLGPLWARPSTDYEVVDPPEWRVLPLASTGLVVRVLDEHGAPDWHADVRVWQASSGRGLRLPLLAEDGSYGSLSLPRGAYRLTVETPSGEWVDLGAHDLGASQLNNVGTHRAAPSAALEFDLLPGPSLAGQRWELWRLDRASPLRMRSTRDAPPARWSLPAGRYLLACWNGERVLKLELGLESGRTTRVRIAEDGMSLRRSSPTPHQRPLRSARCASCHAGGEGPALEQR